MIDCDAHVLEPATLWEEYLEERYRDRAIRITLVPRRASDPLRLEAWGGARKAALLGEVAGVPIEVVAPNGAVLRADD